MMEVSFDVNGLISALDAEALRIDTASAEPKMFRFFYFRRGMQGLASRLYGARLHYNALHAWNPRRIILEQGEYHLANALFNMDSAIECLVFAVNALGNLKEVSKFYDVTDSAALKKIGPSNITGPQARPGYVAYFGTLVGCWHRYSDLIRTVMEHHDVTKHRHAAFGNGRARSDPPEGFFNGIPELARCLITPFETIVLGPEAKQAIGHRTRDWKCEPLATLEQIMTKFKPFIEESLASTLTDAKAL